MTKLKDHIGRGTRSRIFSGAWQVTVLAICFFLICLGLGHSPDYAWKCLDGIFMRKGIGRNLGSFVCTKYTEEDTRRQEVERLRDKNRVSPDAFSPRFEPNLPPRNK